ncbi:hypothetical protein K1719_041297 [Acacia pycnantha]|nr:hypothetical protein K1719_041297 [Acacia pycnantha]
MQALDVRKAPSMSNLYRASIIASCNGLICVLSSSFAYVCSSLSLWNLVTRELGSLEGIVSFDIVMEVFTLMPLPALDTSSVVLKLTVHDKKLALLCHTVMGNFESSSINFWVMEEGMDASGKKWSWMKIYNSSSHSSVLFSFIIWRNEIASIAYVRLGLITIAERKICGWNIT